jgi:hypothetical protein
VTARSPGQILAALLRSRSPEASAARAKLDWTPTLKGLLTRARNGAPGPALAYIAKRAATGIADRQHPADGLHKRLRRFKPGSRGFKRLARQLGIGEKDLRALRSARSRKKRRAVYDALEPAETVIVTERVWPEGSIRDSGGQLVREQMTEYTVAHPWMIRFLDHVCELPYVQLEAIWNLSNYRPGGSPEGAESGGWESSRRESIYLAGLYEAAATIALNVGVSGKVLIRIREYSR